MADDLLLAFAKFSLMESQLEEKLAETTPEIEYDKFGYDAYDSSIEIYGVPVGTELTPEQQQLFSDAGFHRVFVNHVDRSETHYSFWGNDLPVAGSRRPAPPVGAN